jgi:hypothetical protein
MTRAMRRDSTMTDSKPEKPDSPPKNLVCQIRAEVLSLGNVLGLETAVLPQTCSRYTLIRGYIYD